MRDHLPNEKCPVCGADMSWCVEVLVEDDEPVKTYYYRCWACTFQVHGYTEEELEANLTEERKVNHGEA